MTGMASFVMPGLELWFGWMLGVLMGGEGRVGVDEGVPRSARPPKGGKPATTEGGRLGSSGIWNMAATQRKQRVR